jgi:hypothetical protein
MSGEGDSLTCDPPGRVGQGRATSKRGMQAIPMRRQLRYWQPFNDWCERQEAGRRSVQWFAHPGVEQQPLTSFRMAQNHIFSALN